MSYGSPPPPPPQYGAPAPGAVPGTNKKAIWSLVTGVLGLLCIPLVFSVVAIVLARSAKTELATRGGDGNGLATAGLVLGIIGLVLGAIQIILIATGNSLYSM